MAIPLFIVLYFWAIAALVCVVIAWFALLVTGSWVTAVFPPDRGVPVFLLPVFRGVPRVGRGGDRVVRAARPGELAARPLHLRPRPDALRPPRKRLLLPDDGHVPAVRRRRAPG